MIPVTIKVDVASVRRTLSDLANKQVAFAAARAVNALAFEVMRAERTAMSEVFAHPRPFTQRGTVVPQKATKANPTAIVALRPEVAEYLLPYEVGGRHVLPGRALNNPKNVRLDQYGQLPRGTAARLLQRKGVFVGDVKTKHGLVRGFWQRTKVDGKSRLVLLTRKGDALPVNKHLNFVLRGSGVVYRRFDTIFSAELARAIRTAR